MEGWRGGLGGSLIMRLFGKRQDLSFHFAGETPASLACQRQAFQRQAFQR
jgi:hypothetical protein